MSGHSHVPSTGIKSAGFFLVALKELINGFDSGSGLVKLPIWMVGLSVTAIFALPVLIGGALFALIYFLRAIYNEHENNKKEKAKNKENSQLKNTLLLIEDLLCEKINEKLLNEEDIQSKINADNKRKSQEVLSEEIDSLMKEKMTNRYPFLLDPAALHDISSEELLKYLLRDYFTEISNSESYFEQAKHLPSQRKILALIQDVTGFNVHHANFHSQMEKFLGDDDFLQSGFKQFFPQGVINQSSQGFMSSVTSKFKAAAELFKKQKKLRYVGKKIFDFISDFGTGAGLTTALFTMFGVIVVGGAPVTWPLIAAIVGSGVLFGIIALTYQIVSADRNKNNRKQLDKEIKENKIKTKLIQRLLKVQKIPQKILRPKFKNYKIHYESEQEYLDENENQIENMSLLEQNVSPKAKIPKRVYVRMAFGVIGQVISALSLALIISLGIVWVGTVLLPALPLLGPTLGFGMFLSIFHVYRNLKTEVNTIRAELDKYQEVEEQKYLLKKRYKQNPIIEQELNKDNRTLLRELIGEYTQFINNLGEREVNQEKGKYPKQEKIFKLIEMVSGLKRGEDESGLPLKTGNDQFYNELAKYLKGKDKNSDAVNELVTDFKSLFYNPNDEDYITAKRANADDPAINKKWKSLRKVGSVIKDNIFTVVGVIAIGLMLPLFLMGPELIIVGAIAALVVGAFVIARLASNSSSHRMKKLEQEETKCYLIERKQKVQACNIQHFKPGIEPEISESLEVSSEVYKNALHEEPSSEVVKEIPKEISQSATILPSPKKEENGKQFIPGPSMWQKSNKAKDPSPIIGHRSASMEIVVKA